MHRLRRKLGLGLVLATMSTLLVMLAAQPAQAAAGANVALTSPYCGLAPAVYPGSGDVACQAAGVGQTLSSHDGLTAKLTAVAWGGDDAMSAHSALFYIRRTPTVGTEVWHLAGVDSTPAMPDGGPIGSGISVACPPGTPGFGGSTYPAAYPLVPSACPPPNNVSGGIWKAFEVDLNTGALPGGLTGPIDVFVAVCGEGTTSYAPAPGPLGFDARFDRADNNRSGGNLLFPVWDCSNDTVPAGNGIGAPPATTTGATLGWDVVSRIAIDNTRVVVNLPSYPNTGYHGDALPAGGFTLTAVTTPDAGDVSINLCSGVTPLVINGAGQWGTGTEGQRSLTYGGGGAGLECTFPAASPAPLGPGTLAFMQGGPTVWTATFNAAPTPGAFTIPAALVNSNIRIEVNADILGDGVTTAALATTAGHYATIATPIFTANRINAVWDYDAAPGTRNCETGASAATAQIDQWRLTDFDGDGREGLSTAPAPDTGKIDVDDGDNPVLKSCVFGPGGVAFPQLQRQIAWKVLSGPGDVDADQPTYLDGSAVSCFDFNLLGIPISNTCSGGYSYWALALGHGGVNFGPYGGGYARPGSVADAPLNDPLGRGISRVCGIRPCQHSDITDIAFESGVGADTAAVNSTQVGTTEYQTCVDLNGDRDCSANELRDSATMTWTPGQRNHNHAWKSGTESADGHAGTASFAAPAGSTVSITGILHDGGHNPLTGKRVIWRLGTNSPGHVVSTAALTDTLGKAVAVFGSSVLDAGRTMSVLFCGDGDADGICDQTPAQVEVLWGGVVTGTSIINFAVNPTIAVFGTTFTATGTLRDAALSPVSSATVSIQRRIIGQSAWSEVGTAITNGAGAFTLGDVPAFTSDYRAVFAGNPSYTGATSGTDRAWVRVGIAMNVSDPTVFAGQSVRISGRVLPAHPGGVVTLQQLDNGRGWRNIASTRLSAASTYAFVVRHGTPKSLLFRVTFPTQGLLNAWNVSRNIRVTWA